MSSAPSWTCTLVWAIFVAVVGFGCGAQDLLLENNPTQPDASETHVPDNDSVMTLLDFAQMTVRVVEQDGMADYVPTVVFPDAKEVRTLEGIPNDVDHLQALQSHAKKSDWASREFFFAARSSINRLVLGRFVPGVQTEFVEIVEDEGQYDTRVLSKCDQWRLK